MSMLAWFFCNVSLITEYLILIFMSKVLTVIYHGKLKVSYSNWPTLQTPECLNYLIPNGEAMNQTCPGRSGKIQTFIKGQEKWGSDSKSVQSCRNRTLLIFRNEVPCAPQREEDTDRFLFQQKKFTFFRKIFLWTKWYTNFPVSFPYQNINCLLIAGI